MVLAPHCENLFSERVKGEKRENKGKIPGEFIKVFQEVLNVSAREWLPLHERHVSEVLKRKLRKKSSNERELSEMLSPIKTS